MCVCVLLGLGFLKLILGFLFFHLNVVVYVFSGYSVVLKRKEFFDDIFLFIILNLLLVNVDFVLLTQFVFVFCFFVFFLCVPCNSSFFILVILRDNALCVNIYLPISSLMVIYD